MRIWLKNLGRVVVTWLALLPSIMVPGMFTCLRPSWSILVWVVMNLPSISSFRLFSVVVSRSSPLLGVV